MAKKLEGETGNDGGVERVGKWPSEFSHIF
jgi:hypothetical protein